MGNMKVVLVATLVAVAGALKTEPQTWVKAASPYSNINCQCDSLTFRDKYGKKHGNCNSVDKTGAQWCYLPVNGYNTCSDGNGYGFQSTRFPGRKWSYEACATPPNYNYGNSGNSGNSNCVARYGANSPICTPGYNNNQGSGYNPGSSGCSGPRCNQGGYNTGSGSGYNTGGTSLGGILGGSFGSSGSNNPRQSNQASSR